MLLLLIGYAPSTPAAPVVYAVATVSSPAPAATVSGV
jgi:hypothetical protein